MRGTVDLMGCRSNSIGFWVSNHLFLLDSLFCIVCVRIDSRLCLLFSVYLEVEERYSLCMAGVCTRSISLYVAGGRKRDISLCMSGCRKTDILR